jgi:integrase
LRQQKGCVYPQGKSWILRYCDNVMQPDGTIRRKLVCKTLPFPYDGKSKKPPRELREYVADIVAPINKGMLVPRSTIPVAEFIEKVYLPEHVEKKLRPASIKQYKDIWRNHVKAVLPDVALREFRTSDGQDIMDKLAEKGTLGHSSLCHAKAFLSGCFKVALRKGYLEGFAGENAKHQPANPIQNVAIPETPEPEQDTHAYSLKEIYAMLAMLTEPARTVVLTAAFTGFRKSELRGLAWEDFNGLELTINRSVWGTKKLAKKLDPGSASIPVVKQLADALEAHRLRAGILAQPNLPIFQAGNEQPLNLDNLQRRIISPAIEKCVMCRKPESEHPTEGHLFELDKTLCWHGWHAFRRGLATNLHAVGVPDREIQAILRHSDIRLTQNTYIKSVSKSQVNALDLLSETMETCIDLSTKLSTKSDGPVN